MIARTGKEATIALLAPGDFCGEECIALAQPVRVASASAITPCALLRIDRKEMMRALHQEHAFSDIFVAHLLARNARVQEDLVDQLFNSSEKRLARILLLLAHFGKEKAPETVIPKISQEVLAEMVGTTRARVNFFMNRFRKLGFIEYNGSIEVHPSLLEHQSFTTEGERNVHRRSSVCSLEQHASSTDYNLEIRTHCNV